MVGDEAGSAKASGGWFNTLPRKLFAIVGSLALIDDAREFKSNLFAWLDQWKSIIEAINERLFGWIDFWWLEVSDSEAHAITLLLIVAASFARADAEEDADGLDRSIDGLYWPVFVGGRALLFAIMIPGSLGFMMAAAFLISSFGAFALASPLGLSPPGTGGRFFRELGTVGTVVVALVALDAIIEGW